MVEVDSDRSRVRKGKPLSIPTSLKKARPTCPAQEPIASASSGWPPPKHPPPPPPPPPPPAIGMTCGTRMTKPTC
jgi:hypothetical protein